MGPSPSPAEVTVSSIETRHTSSGTGGVDGGLKDEPSHIRDFVATQDIARYPWKRRRYLIPKMPSLHMYGVNRYA